MSLRDELTTILKPGEAEVDLIRRHPMTMIPTVGGGAVLVLLDFFLVAWWFQIATWGALGFSLFLVIGGFLIARGTFEWSRNVLLITTQRIIDINQKGFFRRTVAEAAYEKIQDVRYTVNGIWQTMFQFGAIIIQTAGTTTTLEISGIRHPETVQRLIADTQSASKDMKTENLSAQELVALVERIKKHLGPEAFAQFVKNQPRHGDSE